MDIFLECTEIGNLVFSRGGVELKYKCLETGKESKILIKGYHGPRKPLSTKEMPIKPLSGYYTATDRNFPAIESISEQGMFQFTISLYHPIRGVGGSFRSVVRLSR